jgi:hypothetical protein
MFSLEGIPGTGYWLWLASGVGLMALVFVMCFQAGKGPLVTMGPDRRAARPYPARVRAEDGDA